MSEVDKPGLNSGSNTLISMWKVTEKLLKNFLGFSFLL